MTNQELIQALQEYVQLNQQLAQLIQQKKNTEKEIRYYQRPHEAPQPQRPSKIGIFISDFLLCCVVIYVVMYIASEWISSVTNEILLWLPLCATVSSGILTPIHYKKRNSEACTRYVTEMMKYEQWEQEKQELLPILQEQLDRMIKEGDKIYQHIQNATVTTFLHSDYLPYANTLLGYFERRRVRNLTEAVNLLEQELLEQRRDMQTAAYREKMTQQAQLQTAAAKQAAEQSEHAARAAEEAAFWGAAATFLAANNRKDDSIDNYRVI